jgi:hypothetical protein
MSLSQLQHRPEIKLNASDADLLLRLGIVLALRKRAGWHLVRFGVQNGVVQLAGVVPTAYDRQLIAGMTRHVAGVLRVDDALTVGDRSIRQQVTDADPAATQIDSTTNTFAPHDQFLHLPVLSESLDDILSRQVTGAVASG